MVPGAIFEERFEALRRASSGGMGTVFRARDRHGGGWVALKILRGQDALDVERFAREAAILAGLDHPGIVRFVAQGETTNGEHYLAMEWLEGEDLAERLGHRGLSVAECLTLARRAAEALAFAHARGLVHRDLKPSNLFLVGGDVGRVKLVDFGIARLGQEGKRLTSTGALLGTPGYIAPEQIQGMPAHDPRADVFALGCVLFECLTGRPAFEGLHTMAVLAKILLQEVPRVRALRPAIPEPLDALVARMMARDPEDRPPDGAAVVAELERLEGREEAQQLGPSAAAARPPLDAGARAAALTLTEHRLVTVVLAGHPDAEDVGPSSRSGVVALRAALEPHGGQLDALGGGAFVVTLWGSGSAVDRAERAARCALALKAQFADVPVCVLTGRGLVSSRVVEGDLIERGVRMLAGAQQHAARAVHLDEVTAGMIGHRFRVDRHPGGFVVRGERAAIEGVPLLLGHATPCVGRARELAMLEGIFAGCVSEPAGSGVLIVGEAGSGKTRLRRELTEALRARGERVEILAGAGDSIGAGSPFRLIADAVRRAAGIREGEPLDERRKKLRARLARHLDEGSVERVVVFLGELAGTPFPDEGDLALRAARDSARIMGDAMRAAWEDWLAAECAAQPVLLVLENMQWGDAATVRLVDSTLRNLRDLPLMILVLARPEVHERFPALWAERDVQLIRLGPISRRAAEQLVRAGLGADAPAELVARVVDRAEGNPFYLEELVRAVVAGRAEALPDSVLGTVEARLDAEGPEAKRALRAASVFGDRFTRGGVIALLAGRPEGEVAALLDALAVRELVAPASVVAPAGDIGYAFCHGMVREAAYAMLTEEDRALGHRLAAEWLERSGQLDAMMLAEHYQRGADPARAAGWYLRAAEQALDADDLTAAIERSRLGVACGATGAELGHLLLVQAEAELWQGELAAAEARGVEAAAQLPLGSAGWFRALHQAALAASKRGGGDRVAERMTLAASTSPGRGAASAQLICLAECAAALLYCGRYAEADAVISRLRRVAPDPSALEAPVAAALYHLAAVRASYAGDQGAGLESLEAELGALESAGDRRNACAARSNLGLVFAQLGDFESAEETLRAALSAAERMGLSELAASAMHNLGRALAHLGKLDDARRYEERGIEASRRLGDPRGEGSAHTYLAEIALRAGDLEEAERAARVAADLLRAAPPLRASALAMGARILLRAHRVPEALDLAREAYALLETLGAIEEDEALVRLVYAEALGAAGDRREAALIAAAARERLLQRAAKIVDTAWRERFLAAPDHAKTLALTR